VIRISDDGSNIVLTEDGVDDEPSYALPLAGGELYPLEIIPTPKVRHYNAELQCHVETDIEPSSTLKSVLSEELDPYYGYLGC